MFFFSIISIIFLLFFSLYLSPKIYKEYKIKEYEIRNQIDFEKIIVSNFIEINDNTFLDFKKKNNKYKEVFIKFKDEKDNLIFAEEATIEQNEDKFIFKLINGFRITLIDKNKIEKCINFVDRAARLALAFSRRFSRRPATRHRQPARAPRAGCPRVNVRLRFALCVRGLVGVVGRGAGRVSCVVFRLPGRGRGRAAPPV